MRNRLIPPFILLVFLVIIGAAGLADLTRTNIWSLRFYHTLQHGDRSPADLSPYPESHSSAARWLAQAALDRGDPAGARRWLADSGIEATAETRIILGTALAQEGDLEGGAVLLREHGYIGPLLEIARNARANGDLGYANQAYAAAADIDFEAIGSEYIDFLVTQYPDQGPLMQVLDTLLNAEINPENSLGWLLILADVFFSQEDYDQAIATYTAVLAIDPNHYPAALALGSAMSLRGDAPESAAGMIQAAIEIDPDRSEAYFAMAQIYIRAEQYAEVDPWLVLAIERMPEQRWYWYERGRIAYLAGDLAHSEAAFNAAIKRFPDWAPPWFDLALTLKDAGRPAEALAAIEQAVLFMDPPNAAYYIRKARIHETLAQTNAAVEAYQLALAIDPNNFSANQGLRALEDQ